MSNISALSYLALQVYEEDRFCTFRAVPPHQALALLQNINIADNSRVKLTQGGWELYHELFRGLNQLNNAMASFRRKQTKQKILYLRLRRSTYAVEAGSEVRTDLGPRRRRGRGKIRTKFTLRPQNGCGQHAPNQGIFLPNICADIPGAYLPQGPRQGAIMMSFMELSAVGAVMQ